MQPRFFLRLILTCFFMLCLSSCSMMFFDTPDAVPDFSASPSASSKAALSNAGASVTPSPVPHQIALLLPLQGDLAGAGQAIQAGFNEAYQKSSLKPVIKVYDTSGPDDIDILYDKAVKDGANYVVGPLDKTKVTLLEHHEISVLTIALNNPDSSSYSANLYEFALSPTDEAEQVADKASQAGYEKALMITPAGAWGQNIASAFQARWEKDNGTIVDSLAVDSNTDLDSQIKTLLNIEGNTHREDVDVIFMAVQPRLARQIKSLLNQYQVNNIPVYSTSLVYSGLLDPKDDQDLNGVKFCDVPLVLDGKGQWAALRQEMLVSAPLDVQRYIRLYGLGYDAALLTQNFAQLSHGVSGSTGFLTTDSHHDILRKLNFAVFSNGLPEPLS